MTPHVDIIGNGPPLVFLHCLGTTGVCWGNIVQHLSASYTCYVFDLPGMGWSVDLPPMDLPAIADVVAEVIPESSYVIGWSFGGQVGIQLAKMHPTRVSRLMVIGTTPYAQAVDSTSAVDDIGYFVDQLVKDYYNTSLRYLAMLTQGNRESYDSIKRNVEQITNRPSPSVDQLLQQLDMALNVDLRDIISDVTQPTLIMHGGNDTINKVSMYKYMADAMPHSIEYVIRQGSHAPFLSHPEIVVQIMYHFFNNDNSHKGPKICVTI